MKPLSLKLDHLEPKLVPLLRAEVGYSYALDKAAKETKHRMLYKVLAMPNLLARELKREKDEESKT